MPGLVPGIHTPCQRDLARTVRAAVLDPGHKAQDDGCGCSNANAGGSFFLLREHAANDAADDRAADDRGSDRGARVAFLALILAAAR